MDPILKLIKELTKLPGIGEKSATRLAYHIIRGKAEDAINIANAITDVKQRVRLCSECLNLTETNPCSICSNPKRDKSIICVVEHPQDTTAIEKTGTFNGVYHILHGVISPLDGVGPDDIKTKELIKKIKTGNIHELIVATNPTVEGEATALYIAKLVKPFNIRLTRIAFGIPFGGDIEYVDKVTLSRAIESRSEISG